MLLLLSWRQAVDGRHKTSGSASSRKKQARGAFGKHAGGKADGRALAGTGGLALGGLALGRAEVEVDLPGLCAPVPVEP